MFLDSSQTLRNGDAKVWCYVSPDDHCFLFVPGEMLTRFGQDRVGAQDVGAYFFEEDTIT